MRETELFAEYLTRLRSEKLQQSHATIIEGRLDDARVLAFQADVISRIREALKTLEADPGHFIKEHLK